MGKDLLRAHKNCNCQFSDLNREAKSQLVEWLCWPHHVTRDHATWFPAPQSFPRCHIFLTHCQRNILPMLSRKADPNRLS